MWCGARSLPDAVRGCADGAMLSRWTRPPSRRSPHCSPSSPRSAGGRDHRPRRARTARAGLAAAGLLDAVAASALWLAAAVATVSTLGSLYFSEVANFLPCRLCWFQHVFMYPLAVILLVAAVRRDTGVRWYALPLAGIGASISGYHYVVERFPSLESASCEATGPLCSVPWFESFGFITLALMALVGFLTVAVLLLVARPYAGVVGAVSSAEPRSEERSRGPRARAGRTALRTAERTGRHVNTAPSKHPSEPTHRSAKDPGEQRPQGRSSRSGGPKVSPAVIGIGVALVVVLLAALAFALTSGDEGDAVADTGAAAAGDTATGDTATGEQVLPAGVPGAGPSIGESLPVEPAGDPLPPYESGTPDLAIGMQAPTVNGQGFDGTPITVGGPTDGPTLYVFLAHWCPHCNDEIPQLNELRDAGTLPSDLNVIGVATGSAAEAPNFPPSQWAVDMDWTWPMVADDEIGTTMGYFGGTSFPYTVIVDADGQVLARKAGAAKANAILDWIEAALA